ncbi:hypothetical protein KSS93_15130 [Pseudomonas xanthosomatis]|uniref:hypothetical protein n=1 Tax=Pseudomonas xanthosomatis TaxID=2842356 RepID=UPI001C3CF8CF|nr:hypothetical protein [Pseudomonas xanthosomatis]QXH44231.1 hypothetical protein KSS93_15130 [Pseudomonas xanthosomatis]
MTDLIEVNPLRGRIIQYMQGHERRVGGWFPTWWFKHHVEAEDGTREIRRELERMERDGVVESDHEQVNNTKWRLTCTCPSGDGSLRWPCPAHPPEEKQQ